jgi:hypothetical protein
MCIFRRNKIKKQLVLSISSAAVARPPLPIPRSTQSKRRVTIQNNVQTVDFQALLLAFLLVIQEGSTSLRWQF